MQPPQSRTPRYGNVIYSLRFIYPQDEAKKAAEQLEQERTNQQLAGQGPQRPRNANYWACGSSAIRPVSAYDDGVQTRLRFAAHSEFPAMYVKNDDDSESLLNFTVEGEDVVIHRVSHRFVLRRGRLVACIENRSFDGGGERLQSETLVPGVERRTKGVEQPMNPKNEDGDHGDEDDSVDSENVRTVGGSTVAGERDIPSVNRERSLQSRANNLLALLVVALLGGGFLFYYYSATFSKQREAKAKVEADRTAKASGELKLPPLGAVEGPQAASTDSATPPDKGPTGLGDVMGPAPPVGAAGAAGAGGPPVKTPAELAMERKLTPSVFLRASEARR